MPHAPKVPNFSAGLSGTIQTGDAVQFGCIWCLAEGLTAPAENHVAYMYQGTSFCGPHLKAQFEGNNAQNS